MVEALLEGLVRANLRASPSLCLEARLLVLDLAFDCFRTPGCQPTIAKLASWADSFLAIAHLSIASGQCIRLKEGL